MFSTAIDIIFNVLEMFFEKVFFGVELGDSGISLGVITVFLIVISCIAKLVFKKSGGAKWVRFMNL